MGSSDTCRCTVFCLNTFYHSMYLKHIYAKCLRANIKVAKLKRITIECVSRDLELHKKKFLCTPQNWLSITYLNQKLHAFAHAHSHPKISSFFLVSLSLELISANIRKVQMLSRQTKIRNKMTGLLNMKHMFQVLQLVEI